MNTKQIAQDRQQADGPPCTIRASGHASAFHPFSGPSGLHSAPTAPIPGVSQPSGEAVAASGHQSSRQSHEAAALQEQDVSHQNDRARAGPNIAVHGTAGAADTGSLEAASDTALAEQFRDMGGDAWKVFYMASKMGLRPEIIEKAANRLRGLQQEFE